MAMYPSSNIPTLQDIQEQYRKAAERARGRDVASPFAAATNQMALGRAMDLAALNRQRIEEEQAARAQSVDRGFEMLGGSPAAQRRFQQAVDRGSQQYAQTAAQLGMQQAQAEQREREADYQRSVRETDVGAQFAAMQRKEQLQMQLAQVRARERQLDREAARELSLLKDEADKRRLRVEVRLAQQRLEVQRSQILAGLRQTQMRYPQFSGGSVTASVVSPGGSRNPGAHYASRYAWS